MQRAKINRSVRRSLPVYDNGSTLICKRGNIIFSHRNSKCIYVKVSLNLPVKVPKMFNHIKTLCIVRFRKKASYSAMKFVRTRGHLLLVFLKKRQIPLKFVYSTARALQKQRFIFANSSAQHEQKNQTN